MFDTHEANAACPFNSYHESMLPLMALNVLTEEKRVKIIAIIPYRAMDFSC